MSSKKGNSKTKAKGKGRHRAAVDEGSGDDSAPTTSTPANVNVPSPRSSPPAEKPVEDSPDDDDTNDPPVDRRQRKGKKAKDRMIFSLQQVGYMKGKLAQYSSSATADRRKLVEEVYQTFLTNAEYKFLQGGVTEGVGTEVRYLYWSIAMCM